LISYGKLIKSVNDKILCIRFYTNFLLWNRPVNKIETPLNDIMRYIISYYYNINQSKYTLKIIQYIYIYAYNMHQMHIILFLLPFHICV